MAVRAIKTVTLCRICSADKRPEIDALLEKRSKSEKIGEKRVTLEYVQAAAAEWGVADLSKQTVTGHWKNHCEVIGDKAAEAIDTAAVEKIKRLMQGDDGAKLDADEVLDWIVAIGAAELEEKIKQGQRSGVTPDMMLKAIDAKTRRGHAEAQSDLLRGLGGGIAAYFSKALPGQVQPAIEAGEVIEDADIQEDS